MKKLHVRPQEGDYNVTSEDKMSKFSMNLPFWMRDKVQEITNHNSIYGGREGTFVRIAIAEKLASMGFFPNNEEGTISPAELANREVSGKVYNVQREYPDPPKKYQGFIAGRQRNSYFKTCVDRLTYAFHHSAKN